MGLTLVLEAKCVAQAVKIARDKLEISPENLKYDVISYGSTSIFGILRTTKAKLRVFLAEEKAETHNTDETRIVERIQINVVSTTEE